MARCKDVDWKLPEPGEGRTWEHVIVAVLMDIRDEVKQLNRVFGCWNFQQIPGSLRSIKRNTAKPRKKKAR